MIYKDRTIAIQRVIKNEWAFEYASQSAAYNEVNKRHIYQTLTIDMSSGNPRGSDIHFQQYNSQELYHSSIGEYLSSKLGFNNKSFTSWGMQMYGSGKNMKWQNGLPSGKGSESLDLGKWLDLVGTLRPGTSEKDIAEDFIKDNEIIKSSKRFPNWARPLIKLLVRTGESFQLARKKLVKWLQKQFQ